VVLVVEIQAKGDELSWIELWSTEPEKGESKRVHKYLVLLVNPFLCGVFFDVQNAPENFYKSQGVSTDSR
jgi:hypothetical protein